MVKANKHQVFRIIVDYATKYRGAMPSTREIAAKFGDVTHTTIATRIKAMVEDGTLFYLDGHLCVRGAVWYCSLDDLPLSSPILL